MPTFQFTSPDGKNYSVNGPDGATPEQAFQVLQTQIGGGGSGSSASPIGDDRAATVAALRGIPLAGAYVDKGAAMLNAVAQPFTETGLSHADNYADRAAENEKTIKAAADKYENDHSIETGIGKTVVGAGALAPLGATALGARAMGMAGEALLPSILKGAASFGALNGVDAGLRGDSVGKGLVTGALGGAAGPLAGKAIELGIKGANAVGAPILASVRALRDPEGFAQSQFARGVSESGKTPEQIAQAVQDANAAGQPFTPADAMDNAGQGLLAAAARGPGEGRTAITKFLNDRQAGQADRVGDIIDTGLGAGGTARQTADQLTQTARSESAPFYQKALDKKPVWSDRMQQFFDDPATKSGIKEGVAVQRLEALAEGKKFDPNDYAITKFDENGDPVLGPVPNMRTINLIKKGWDNQLEAYRDGTTGKLMLDEKGRALDNVRRSFLKEVDSLNPDYAMARALYAGPAQVRDAVTAGGQAATRGRAADNLARFRAMTDPSKQGYRIGYADNLAGKIEGAVEGANKVRPFSSPKAQQQLGELSLHQGPVQPGEAAPMQKLLGNEQTMFDSRARATGNSKTVENLADDEAMGVDPHLLGIGGHIMAGNYKGALHSAITAGRNTLTGNTPAVRAQLGQMLLDRGVKPADIQKAIDHTVARVQFVQALAKRVGNGAGNGLLIAGPSHKQNVN